MEYSKGRGSRPAENERNNIQFDSNYGKGRGFRNDDVRRQDLSSNDWRNTGINSNVVDFESNQRRVGEFSNKQRGVSGYGNNQRRDDDRNFDTGYKGRGYRADHPHDSAPSYGRGRYIDNQQSNRPQQPIRDSNYGGSGFSSQPNEDRHPSRPNEDRPPPSTGYGGKGRGNYGGYNENKGGDFQRSFSNAEFGNKNGFGQSSNGFNQNLNGFNVNSGGGGGFGSGFNKNEGFPKNSSSGFGGNNGGNGYTKSVGCSYSSGGVTGFEKSASGFGNSSEKNEQRPVTATSYNAFEDSTRTPSASSSSFYSNFGGGFGSGFPTFSEPESVIKQDTSTKSMGGFMDWQTVEREMKEAETAKWANLVPIIKDFYKEDPEIAGMTEDDADTFRLSKNNIMVEDLKKEQKRMPQKPVKTFRQAFNDPEILDEIEKQKFVEPSPIQSQMWPLVLSGHDVIGIAQTGTGKTLAFLLPIFVHLENQPLPRLERKGPGCLILSPTRELALQIHSEIKKFRYHGIRSICIYGGGDRKKQMDACLEGVDIIIATPGRLNDLVCADCIKLRTITFLVLDEADRMLDMGFEPQIKKVLMDIRPDRQTVMTSATWPKGVRELADRYTKDPFLIVIGSLDLTATHSVTQVIQVVSDETKRTCVIDFLTSLNETEKCIVFVGKKSFVDDLASDLARMGIKCQSLHGDRDQSDREQALDDIKKGKVRILIATDVASRGLDIVDITHVYNYDFPRHLEEYVHRVGRTGRAGKVGVSITLMTKYDWRHAGELIRILEEAKQEVPHELQGMADRWAQKLADNPDYGKERKFTRKRSEPYFMEDYF